MKNKEDLQKEIKNLEQRREDARVLFMKCEGGIETLHFLIQEMDKETTEKNDKKVGKKSDS